VSPWDYEALWLKAKLFVNRSMDDEPLRSFDEQAFWASQALELLGKAALSRAHPALIAEPNEDGVNILIASGLVEGDARLKTVQAKTVFSRCERAFKPFSYSEAMKFANSRNAYVHGGEAAFTLIPARAWWPKFWAQAIVLINALDRTAEDLVGSQRIAVVEAHLAQNKQNLETRVEMLVERARQRFGQISSGVLTQNVAKEMAYDAKAGLSYSIEADCPACDGAGTLEGEEVTDTDVDVTRISEDDYELAVTLTIWAEHFSCPNCGLVLDSPEYLELLNMETEFTVPGDESDIADEGEYGND
jgi:hypothetical protein